MKTNFLLIALFAMGLFFGSCSNDDNNDLAVVPYENLPAESKQFITDHFADYDVTKTIQSADGYAVSLSKKTKSAISYGSYEIKFDRQGRWIEIEGRNDAVLPDNVLALIPRSIVSYVGQNYPPRGITEIKKETYGYKIELAGNPDTELMFDYNGEFLAKDDDNNDGIIIEYNQLPAPARLFLTTHFSGQTASRVEKEKDGYEVKFANKIEVDFDLAGNWREVDVNKNQMPQTIMALLPQKILDYISLNHSSKKVESVENKVSTYRVELNGDVNLVFDKEGNLWNTGGNNDNNNGRRVQFSELPQSVQAFLTEHFLAGTTFLYAEKEGDEYEIKLANGTKVEFYIDGGLKSVEVLPGNSVPDSVVLGAILTYVKSNYANKKIEEYEKKKIGYKVELSGYPELELIFDSNGKFKGIDR